MHEVLLGCRGQSAGNLKCDKQSLSGIQRSFPLHVDVDGLAVDKLHGVKIALMIRTKMKDGSDILMAQSSRCARLSQKPLTSHLTREIGVIDNLQSYRTSQVRVVSLVGNAHRTPA